MVIAGVALAAAVLAPAVFAETSPARAGEGAALVPHKAVYQLSLREAQEAAGITDVRGLMVYDFRGDACAGYSTDFRFMTEFVDAAGEGLVTDLRSSAHETADGGRLTFATSVYMNQALQEQSEGVAETAAGKVTLKQPQAGQLDLPQAAIFPTTHLRKVLAAARRGETLLLADVYDGSETGDKVFATTTVIGARQQPSGGKTAAGDVLPEVAAWPVSIAYFDPASETGGEETPAYQMSFLLYENGISGGMTLNYGDFILDGQLDHLELSAETAPCTGG